MKTFRAALSITAPNQKHSNAPQTEDEWTKCIHMYPSIWWDTTPAKTQIHVKAIMPSERIQTQATHCMIPYAKFLEKAKLKTESRWGAGWGWGQRLTTNGYDWKCFAWCRCFKTRLWWWLHDYVNWLKITLYTYNGWILWHVNYTTIQRHEN